MFISLSWLGMLILLLPFEMNCKVIWLSVWDVSKNDYTNTCISFDEGCSYRTRFRNAPCLSELLQEKNMIKPRAGVWDMESGSVFLLDVAVHLEVELNDWIPKE